MMNSLVSDELYNTYLQALLARERTQCVELVNGLLERKIPMSDLYVHLFQRAMYQVGELWEFNRISVAVERLATAITEGLLTLFHLLILAAEHIGKKAVISCVASEHHQLGGKMAEDFSHERPNHDRPEIDCGAGIAGKRRKISQPGGIHQRRHL